MIPRRILPWLALPWLLLAGSAWSADLAISPFQTGNRAPMTQIFGLPTPGHALLLPPGEHAAELALDTTQNYTHNSSGDESAFFDGETYRFNLNLRRGLTPRFEVGLDVPYLMHRGGFLDGFIEGWHDTFTLPQNGRDRASRDRLRYSYIRNGKQEVLVDDHAQGLGDIRLNAAWQLTRSTGGEPWGAALHAALKLPTGDSDDLLGSGSTDLSLWLSGNRTWLRENSAVALFGSCGFMGMTDGDVIEERQRNLVGFAMLGGGWRPWSWLVLKLQIDGHTPLYDSDLKELGDPAALLTVGGDLALGNKTALEIGVSEDIATETAPDVVFRLALRSRF
ncbi:DUF3187 family protein [Trichloromonas sp.]|uniref:DUF3187 family protein n=1 Tax=Trichloromonas sp. TaxID=3069249 RepID=UPI002A3E9A82|nr:DUF3187 family protein [Trichloromonas sp.]